MMKLLQNCGLHTIISAGDKVAVKMHLGEPGSCRYLRPIFPALLVDFIKQCGGKPFVTDAPVMYKSPRNNYFGYLDSARRNGFTAETMGCPIVISGGLKDNGVTVNVPDPLILPQITVSQDIWDADFLLSLAHFTMHLEFPYAGSLKNIAMGSMDRDTKMAMHSAKKFHPPHLNVQAANADGAKVMLTRFKNKFFALNLALDVTPECDCFDKTDLPIIPDIGVFASLDPAACDKAAYDKVLAAPGYPGCLMESHPAMLPGGNKVAACHSKQSDAAAHDDFLRQAGISSLEYDLIEI